jgi:S-adenosylmethionine hydrolase
MPSTANAACGVITLTTDFGHKDPFVGVMKGRIYERFGAARIVDLTHEILAHWPAEAGFWLARSFGYFPRGTVHVAVVDPGVGTAREILVVEAAGHWLLAPDNGLLAPVVARHPGATIRRLDLTRLGAFGLGRASATFHGRDIFAPLAAELAAGRALPAELGPQVDGLVPAWVDEPQASGGAISGVVITVDHFGNLISNIDSRWIAGLVEPHVYAGNRVLPVRRTYGDARPGEYLALVNSFDVLEIACAEGSAADGLGLSRGAPVVGRDAVRRS